MNYPVWLVMGFLIWFVVLALCGNDSARGRSSNADDDDDDSYKRLQDEMKEDNLYRLWQDSDY